MRKLEKRKTELSVLSETGTLVSAGTSPNFEEQCYNTKILSRAESSKSACSSLISTKTAKKKTGFADYDHFFLTNKHEYSFNHPTSTYNPIFSNNHVSIPEEPVLDSSYLDDISTCNSNNANENHVSFKITDSEIIFYNKNKNPSIDVLYSDSETPFYIAGNESSLSDEQSSPTALQRHENKNKDDSDSDSDSDSDNGNDCRYNHHHNYINFHDTEHSHLLNEHNSCPSMSPSDATLLYALNHEFATTAKSTKFKIDWTCKAQWFTLLTSAVSLYTFILPVLITEFADKFTTWKNYISYSSISVLLVLLAACDFYLSYISSTAEPRLNPLTLSRQNSELSSFLLNRNFNGTASTTTSVIIAKKLVAAIHDNSWFDLDSYFKKNSSPSLAPSMNSSSNSLNSQFAPDLNSNPNSSLNLNLDLDTSTSMSIDLNLGPRYFSRFDSGYGSASRASLNYYSKPSTYFNEMQKAQLYAKLVKKYLPAHEHYCYKCKNILSNCDHHCQWLNTCIHKENYNLFILTLFLAILYSSLILVLSAVFLSIAISDYSHFTMILQKTISSLFSFPILIQDNILAFAAAVAPLLLAISAFLFALSLVVSISIICLLSFHAYLCLVGKSTFDLCSSQ